MKGGGGGDRTGLAVASCVINTELDHSIAVDYVSWEFRLRRPPETDALLTVAEYCTAGHLIKIRAAKFGVRANECAISATSPKPRDQRTVPFSAPKS